MKAKMRRFFFVTDDEGKKVLSWLRTVLALVSTALVGVLLSWFIWVTTQAYDVATNKALIKDTATRLEKNIKGNADDIVLNEMEAERHLEKMLGILHGRINNEIDKREKNDERLMDLVIKILEQQQKQVEIQQKGLEKQEELFIQQQAR